MISTLPNYSGSGLVRILFQFLHLSHHICLQSRIQLLQRWFISFRVITSLHDGHILFQIIHMYMSVKLPDMFPYNKTLSLLFWSSSDIHCHDFPVLPRRNQSTFNRRMIENTHLHFSHTEIFVLSDSTLIVDLSRLTLIVLLPVTIVDRWISALQSFKDVIVLFLCAYMSITTKPRSF